MLRGKGEVRSFNWKTGQGIIHKTEFVGCQKDCFNPEHCISFNWRQALSGKVDVDEGTIVAYVAHPKGDEIARAKAISPTWGI